MQATTILDDFNDLAVWTVFASGQAQLNLASDTGPSGRALRLDFDFHGGGGFVVARRLLPLQLPESYCFDFNIRGNAPPNIFEFKLADATNANVWRYRAEEFLFPHDWQPFTIRSSQIEFAWGPRGGGQPCDIAALEIVIAAGTGGKGSVWFDTIRLTDTTYRLTPSVHASSALPGYEPCTLCDAHAPSAWRSASDEPQWLLIDFHTQREYGGLTIEWEPGLQARALSIAISGDSTSWQTVYQTDTGGALRTFVFIPQTASRFIKINLDRSVRGTGFGIRTIQVKPFDFSRSINHFFQNIAQEYPVGMFPKYFCGKQTYWTPVGTGSGDGQALINEEGMVEVAQGSFSIEPFLYHRGRLITWADVALRQELTKGYLPIPSSIWHIENITLSIIASATHLTGEPLLFLQYRICNTGEEHEHVTLFTAIRPFQVTPFWQHWRMFGGAAPVRELDWNGTTVLVNRLHPIIPVTTPAGFGAAAFDEGQVTEYLKQGVLPPHATLSDAFGYASAALRFECSVAAGSHTDIYLAVPMRLAADSALPQSIDAATGVNSSEKVWEQKLAAVSFSVPPEARTVADSFKTAVAHILINRDGPALHPGPRRYSRSWIRDGVIMGAAVARAGHPEVLRDFLSWYSQFQAPDGTLPDCADAEGTEWLPEFDAYGQFLFGVMEYYRFSHDRAFLEAMQPAVAKTIAALERLRSQRLTPAYREGERQACYGLLPESMSHEGYMAHPVHAYWDDFWAVRGLQDSADMAAVLGDTAEALRRRTLGKELAGNITASLAATIQRHRIDYIPGSVEFGDFDPTATSNAIGLLDLLELLPLPETHRSYDRYFEGLRSRTVSTSTWQNYTAYEIRIVGALVRLGRRADAVELLEFLLREQRIPAWHQWPEITWRDPTSPSFIGDLPHTWISAEYILSACSLFAYERNAERSLVIAAGIAPQWLESAGEIGVQGLPTYYGNISYRITCRQPALMHLNLWGEISVPEGGIVVQPPLHRQITSVQVNGNDWVEVKPECFTLRTCPAEVVVHLGEALV